MEDVKAFLLEDVISATSGFVLGSWEGLYKVLGFVTGQEGLLTHELIGAATEARPYIYSLYPELALIKAPLPAHRTGNWVEEWLVRLHEEFPPYLCLVAMPQPASDLEPLRSRT